MISSFIRVVNEHGIVRKVRCQVKKRHALVILAHLGVVQVKISSFGRRPNDQGFGRVERKRYTRRDCWNSKRRRDASAAVAGLSGGGGDTRSTGGHLLVLAGSLRGGSSGWSVRPPSGSHLCAPCTHGRSDVGARIVRNPILGFHSKAIQKNGGYRVWLNARRQLDATGVGGATVRARGARCTIIDPARLRAEIDKVRGQGFSLVDEELEAGVRSIAVPLYDRTGACIAALNIRRRRRPHHRAAPARRLPARAPRSRPQDDRSAAVAAWCGWPPDKDFRFFS